MFKRDSVLFSKGCLLDQVLKGIGQIMLQENRWTGLLFLIGLFLGDWQFGVGTLLATLSGTLMARLCKFQRERIDAGLYGFSAALVGIALVFIFDDTLLIWILVIIGGLLAALIQHLFMEKKVPAFTFPFILTTWVLVYVLRTYIHVGTSAIHIVNPDSLEYGSFFGITRGFGEVMFQGGLVASLFIFLGVFISNPIAALYGLAASMIGAAASEYHGLAVSQVHMGLFGFNAVLTAIVFAGIRKIDGFWVLLGVFFTVLLNDCFLDYHLFDQVGGVFTFPFVVGSWMTLLVQKLFKRSKRLFKPFDRVNDR